MHYFLETMTLVLASLRFIFCTILLLQFHYVCKNFQLTATSRAPVVESLMLILCFPNEVFSG
jgi:hypothetical protein